MDVLHKKRSRHLAAIRNIRRSLKIWLQCEFSLFTFWGIDQFKQIFFCSK